MPRLAFGGTDAAGDWRLLRADGSEAWVHRRVRHAKTVNVRTCVVTLTEIETHKANELRLLHLATHDPLTGLANRDTFMERVELALGRAARDHVTAMLFVDLDRFKQVNDRYGHQCGDKLLASVARRLRDDRAPLRRSRPARRDELGIVCEVAEPEDATHLADRVVSAVAEPFTIDGEVLTIGASVGIATASPSTTTSEQLVAEADRAMYPAKESGGSQWWIRGARAIDARSRHAVAEANAALAQLGLDLVRLQQRTMDLRQDTTHLHDENLSVRLEAINSALELARTLAEQHPLR